jgi:hypothetical protein
MLLTPLFEKAFCIDVWRQVSAADAEPKGALGVTPTTPDQRPAERRVGDAEVYFQPPATG